MDWLSPFATGFVVPYVPSNQFDAHLTMSGRFLVHEKAEVYHPLFCGQITKAKASMKLSEDRSSEGSREVA